MSQSVIVYDVETKHTFAEVNGPDKYRQLEVSFLGVYSYSQDKFFSFFEQDLSTFERILVTEQPTIIGFNSLHFDNRVVQPYFRQLNIASLPQVDILDDIYRALGFRLKLESVAQATLGEGKSGSGLDAIRYYREGNLKALAKYCLDDVRITRDIYDYGCRHGYILYSSGGEYQRMPVGWSTLPTIADQIQAAWQEHRRVTLHCLQLTEGQRVVLTMVADILELTDRSVQVYIHGTNTTALYPFDRILQVQLTEQTSAYQAQLL